MVIVGYSRYVLIHLSFVVLAAEPSAVGGSSGFGLPVGASPDPRGSRADVAMNQELSAAYHSKARPTNQDSTHW